MSFQTIIVKKGNDFVAEIILNRPKNLNTFNDILAKELDEVLLQLDSDNDVRVIIIKGEGKHFCAGIDINDFAGKNAMQYKEWVEGMETPFITMSKMKKPIIAQVHGIAAANGAGLVAATDLAIAGENAKIGLTAINVGLNCIGPVIPVSRSVGRKKALELLFFGDLISANEALRIGLINKTFPESDLEKETRNWARKLAEKSPIALQIAKKAFYQTSDMSYEQSFNFMNEVFARLCSTDEAKEGVDAFINKRELKW